MSLNLCLTSVGLSFVRLKFQSSSSGDGAGTRGISVGLCEAAKAAC